MQNLQKLELDHDNYYHPNIINSIENDSFGQKVIKLLFGVNY